MLWEKTVLMIMYFLEIFLTGEYQEPSDEQSKLEMSMFKYLREYVEKAVKYKALEFMTVQTGYRNVSQVSVGGI